MLNRRLARFWVAAPAIVIGSSIVVAQKPAPASRPIVTTTNGSTAKEVDPEVAQRRSIALALLSSLAIEARSYRDDALRSRVQARVAEALWERAYDLEPGREVQYFNGHRVGLGYRPL